MKQILLALLFMYIPPFLYADQKKSEETERLVTPTLWALAPDMFACNLTNIDNREHQVQVRIVSNGKVLLKSKILSLAPRHTTNQKVKGLPKGAPLYCEFSVEGDGEMYRGVAVLYHAPAGSDFVAVPAT